MMAVEGIGTLVQRVADQLLGQTLETTAGANTPGTGNVDNASVTEDTFTPSTQNNSAHAAEQDAGLFQVRQGHLTAVKPNLLFASTSPNANQNGSPAQPASTASTNAGNAQPATATNSNLPVNAGQLFPPPPAAQVAAAKAAATTNVQEQIQALNAALPALGLTKEEIQEIDRFAKQIQNFNPAAYSNLIHQFETQAHQVMEQGTANAAANASTGANKNTTASTKTNSGAPQI
jgi:hypothetical protein